MDDWSSWIISRTAMRFLQLVRRVLLVARRAAPVEFGCVTQQGVMLSLYSTHSMWYELNFFQTFLLRKNRKKAHTMSTLFDPDSACPFYIMADCNIPGSLGQLVVTTSTPGVVNANEHIIGLCLTDNNCDVGTKLTLKRDVTSTGFSAHDIGIARPDGKPSFYADSTDSFAAVDGNLLGIPTGSAFKIHYGGKDANLGFLFDTSMRFVALSLDVKGGGAAPTHDRKRRSVLKRVEVTADDGKTKMLTVENSMRAIVAWLDKMNQDHASTYSVDRLVWCEEQSSARSEKGTIRGWFKHDVSDNKRKVIPNASDAIVAMEQITKTDHPPPPPSLTVVKWGSFL